MTQEHSQPWITSIHTQKKETWRVFLNVSFWYTETHSPHCFLSVSAQLCINGENE